MSQSEVPKTDLLPVHKLDNLKENKTSKRDRKKEQIVAFVVKDLKNNPNLSRTDFACIAQACQLIENFVKKKDKIDKFDLVVRAFCLLFPGLQPAEIEILRRLVQTVLDSKLVKKIGKHIEFYSYVKKVFISNFLFRDSQRNHNQH